MQTFTLPLSRHLDFGVDSNGLVCFRAYDGRMNLHLTPDEFLALLGFLRINGGKIAEEIKMPEGANHE